MAVALGGGKLNSLSQPESAPIPTAESHRQMRHIGAGFLDMGIAGSSSGPVRRSVQISV